MKETLLMLGVVLTTLSATAQIRKGDWTLSGDLRIGMTIDKEDDRYDYRATLNGSGGIFVADGLQIGTLFGVTSRSMINEKQLDYKYGYVGIGPYVNYYSMLSPKTYWRSHIGIPLNVGWNTDYSYITEDVAEAETHVNVGYSLQTAIGIGRFINRIWGVEVMLNYNNYVVHDIYLSGGLRYFISTKLGDE